MEPRSTNGDPDLDAGFADVDAQPDASGLIEGMEATAQWPAVRELRTWERDHLRLSDGDRLLDVGCGIGDAVSALARDLEPGGEALGVDASAAMLDVARQHADGPGLTFVVGDAMTLEVADGSFDACRSERMLQWLPDLDAAVAEMVRVLRPGGRLSLIDTDWRTFALDLPDVEAAAAAIEAVRSFRDEASWAGGRLLNACRRLGLTDLAAHAATHLWTSWDPDTEPGPAGLFPIEAIFTQLAEQGRLDPGLAARFIADIQEAGRNDRLHISLTMFAVRAVKP